jgi:hypothetical protein
VYAQEQFGRVPEAGDKFVISRDFVLAPAVLVELDRLIEEFPGFSFSDNPHLLPFQTDARANRAIPGDRGNPEFTQPRQILNI